MKKEINTESGESSLPACVVQPTYGSSMPPPPGIEPVQLPKPNGDQNNSKQIKEEPVDGLVINNHFLCLCGYQYIFFSYLVISFVIGQKVVSQIIL